jgi:predicted dehydrogenase
MTPIGVAVVGAGYWGRNLIRNFAMSPDFELRWVCDVEPSRAEGMIGPYGGVRVTADLAEVLADDAVQAVAVATPADTHLKVALTALEADRNVLVEKPLASSLADAERVVKEAEERGLVLMCDHTYCYTPAVLKMAELVSSGVLGEIQYVDSVRVNLGLVQPDVDVLWDLAPHDLSILDLVLPPGARPEAVSAHGADPIGAGRACVAYLTLQLEGSAIAHTHVNWLSPTKIRTMIVGGSKRTLVWDDLNPGQRLSVYDRGVDLRRRTDLGPEERRAAAVSYRSGDVVAPALAEREALQGVCDELADCIRTGRTPRTDGRSGLRVLDVLEAASRSLRYHGAIVPLRRAS